MCSKRKVLMSFFYFFFKFSLNKDSCKCAISLKHWTSKTRRKSKEHFLKVMKGQHDWKKCFWQTLILKESFRNRLVSSKDQKRNERVNSKNVLKRKIFIFKVIGNSLEFILFEVSSRRPNKPFFLHHLLDIAIGGSKIILLKEDRSQNNRRPIRVRLTTIKSKC